MEVCLHFLICLYGVVIACVLTEAGRLAHSFLFEFPKKEHFSLIGRKEGASEFLKVKPKATSHVATYLYKINIVNFI
jgi:hypothetical protein